MLPFEFTVPGPPLSHQTRDRQKLSAWRLAVQTAAALRWGTAPAEKVSLRLAVTYYHEGDAVRIDNDNLLKPVQDALNQLVYEDDRQVTDAAVRKTSIDGEFRVRGASPVLLMAFVDWVEFIYVKVEAAPDDQKLLS
jgi:hypothetical protein